MSPVVDYLSAASPKTIKDFRSQHAEAGVQASTFSLLKIIRDKFPDFDPPGLKEYISKTDTSNNQEAYQCLLQIETMIHEFVVLELKKKFGDGWENWWFKGVKEKIRSSAVEMANKEGKYNQFEKYLYLIDLKQIIEDNWDIFSETCTIRAKATDSKAKKLAWYDELNKIRNLVDHPPRGGVDNNQLAFIVDIKNVLTERLRS